MIIHCHLLSLVAIFYTTRCHFIATCCHSFSIVANCFLSLSPVAIRCCIHCQLLSLIVSLVVTRSKLMPLDISLVSLFIEDPLKHANVD